MDRNDIVGKFYSCYSYFLKEIYGVTKKKTEADLRTIDKFLSELNSKNSRILFSIGKSYTLKYCIFQFDYWFNLDIEKYKNGIPVSWIFGDKAVERWISRNIEFDWTISQKEFLTNLNISLSVYDVFGEKEFDPRIKNVTEELEKKRYEQEDLKLANCTVKTSLYSPKSRTCRKCSASEKCKAILESRFPILYKERMGSK